jgi:hypothetical protein
MSIKDFFSVTILSPIIMLGVLIITILLLNNKEPKSLFEKKFQKICLFA